MIDKQLSKSDLEYMAEMLRAVVFFKEEISPISETTLSEIETTLKAAEAALRRAVAEMASNDGSSSSALR